MKTVLKIYGDIGQDDPFVEMFGETTNISAKKVSDFLDENPEATEITVRINSRGGDVQEGWAIHDLLANSGKKITTVGEGKVYSIATIIFLVGSEREMMKNADGVIHNPFIPPYTLADKYESDDLEKLAEELRQEEEKILDYYVERTGSSREKLEEYMNEDTKLSAEDMLTLGFATKILEPVMAYCYVLPKNKKMEDKKFFDKLNQALDRTVDKLKNLSRLAPEQQILADADGNEIVLDKSEGEIAVGDKASPDGTFMIDGKTVVIAAGVVESITAEKTELDLAQERITELEAEVESLKNEAQAVENSREELQRATAEAKALHDELSALRNSWVPAARAKRTTVVDDGGVDFDKLKEIRTKKSE